MNCLPWEHWERKQGCVSRWLSQEPQLFWSICRGWLPSLHDTAPLVQLKPPVLQVKDDGPPQFAIPPPLGTTERVLNLLPAPETQEHWDHNVHSDTRQVPARSENEDALAKGQLFIVQLQTTNCKDIWFELLSLPRLWQGHRPLHCMLIRASRAKQSLS